MPLIRAETHADKVRLPRPHRGEVLIVKRYEGVKAVVLHPDDYTEMEQKTSALEEISRPASTMLSDLGARAHEIVESHEAPRLEDESEIREFLGL
jgi:hypothetical protein